MNTAKIGVVFLVAVLALAGVGMSYAGYMDVITITGTATTGSVDMDLVGVWGTWTWKEIDVHTRHVNKGTATLEDINGDGEAGDDVTAHTDPDGSWYVDSNMLLYSYATAFAEEDDDDLIHVKWHNAVPVKEGGDPNGLDVTYDLALWLHYTGKTPARIDPDGPNGGLNFGWGAVDDVDVDGDGTPDGPWIQYLLDQGLLTYAFFYDADPEDGPYNPDVDDQPIDICDQLHYCDHIWLVFNGEIPQNNAFQNLKGDMTLTIDLLQFDEAICDEECSGKIGDFVWYDSGEIPNGIQDSGEIGVPEVPVILYDGSGNLLAQTLTDSDGYYEFDNLDSGNYQVQFIIPEDSGLSFTQYKAGTDTSVDSDADPNNENKSEIITLSCDQSRMDLDAGVYEPQITDEKLIPEPDPTGLVIDIDDVDWDYEYPDNPLGEDSTYGLKLGDIPSAYEDVLKLNTPYYKGDNWWACWCVGNSGAPPYDHEDVMLYGSWNAGTSNWPADLNSINDEVMWSKINWIFNHRDEFVTDPEGEPYAAWPFNYAVWNIFYGYDISDPASTYMTQARDIRDAANDYYDTNGLYWPEPGGLLALLIFPGDENGNLYGPDYAGRDYQATFTLIDP